MKKQLVIVGIILVLLTVGLSGCNEKKANDIGNEKSDAEKIVGTWEYQVDPYRERIRFTADGHLYAGEKEGNYLLEDGYINATFASDDSPGSYNKIFKYSFENDDTLVMEDVEYGRVRIYSRVE